VGLSHAIEFIYLRNLMQEPVLKRSRWRMVADFFSGPHHYCTVQSSPSDPPFRTLALSPLWAEAKPHPDSGNAAAGLMTTTPMRLHPRS